MSFFLFRTISFFKELLKYAMFFLSVSIIFRFERISTVRAKGEEKKIEIGNRIVTMDPI